MSDYKTHTTLTLNGQTRSGDELRTFCNEQLIQQIEDWEKNIYTFILEWLNDKDYIIAHTSGSTGKPKEIQLPKNTLVESAKNTCAFFNLTKESKTLLCIPSAFIGGKMMLVRGFVSGMDVHTIKPSSSPLEQIKTCYHFVALTPQQAMKSSREALEYFAHVIIGGGEVKTALENKLRDIKCNNYSTYGMTETASHVALKHIGKKEYFEALPNIMFTKDERNCLTISAPTLLENPLITNDVVELLSPTQFIWKGRYDNVINSGGIKIYPEEVEKKLEPFIAQRFFIGKLPDNILGEKVVLVIESEQDLNIDFSRTTLTPYQKPKQILYTKQFSETESGKVKRDIHTLKTKDTKEGKNL
jgi:o-succinylbenzoate---CoA ligase